MLDKVSICSLEITFWVLSDRKNGLSRRSKENMHSSKLVIKSYWAVTFYVASSLKHTGSNVDFSYKGGHRFKPCWRAYFFKLCLLIAQTSRHNSHCLKKKQGVYSNMGSHKIAFTVVLNVCVLGNSCWLYMYNLRCVWLQETVFKIK